MNIFQLLLSVLGRVCLASIFIVAGLQKILDWDASMQYAYSMLSNWQVYLADIPLAVRLLGAALSYLPLLLGVATFLELGGGALVFLGLRIRLGAFLLLAFLIPTTLLFHPFWYLEGAERNLQNMMFMKNIAIIGGLFTVLAFGTGFRKKERRIERD